MAKDITMKDMNARVDKLREKLRTTDSEREAKKVAKEAAQEAKRIESEATKKAMKVAREVEDKADNAVKSINELKHCVKMSVCGQRHELTTKTENYLTLMINAVNQSLDGITQELDKNRRKPVDQISSMLEAEKELDKKMAHSEAGHSISTK